MLPVMINIGDQVIRRGQTKSGFGMKHGKIFKVVICIANGCIKYHLPEQRICIFPGLAAEFIDGC